MVLYTKSSVQAVLLSLSYSNFEVKVHFDLSSDLNPTQIKASGLAEQQRELARLCVN